VLVEKSHSRAVNPSDDADGSRGGEGGGPGDCCTAGSGGVWWSASAKWEAAAPAEEGMKRSSR